MSEAIVYCRGTRVQVREAPDRDDLKGKDGTVLVVNQDNGLIGVSLDDTDGHKDLLVDLPPQYLVALFETCCIRSEETVLPYLGGQLETNHIPMDTAYGRLSRDPTLPSLHSKDKSFSDNHVKEDFMKIFAGEFTADWWQNGSEFFFYADSVDVRDENESHGRLIELRFIDDSETPEAEGFQVETYMSGQGFVCSLTESQRLALSLRVLHRFLRVHGSYLAGSVVEMLVGHLYKSYAQEKWWKEHFDVCMILADIAFNKGSVNIQISKALRFVGTSLVCQGRFKQAAEVYEQVALDYALVSEKVSDYWDSGNAYMSANDPEAAERAYLMALHFDSTETGGWDLDSPQSSDLIIALLDVYSNQLKTLTSATTAWTECSTMMQLMIGLLYGQGFRGHGDFNTMLQTSGPLLSKALKNEFREKNGARQALVRAVSYPDVASFRSVIVSCKIPNYKMAVPKYPADATSEGQERRDRNAMRKAIHKEITKEKYTLCANCGKLDAHDNGDFKTCPCRAVSYCQKSCQVSHWKMHKQVCVWKKNQKKNETSA